MIFFDSGICETGEHCEHCRDRDGGRKFRSNHPYELPPEGVDFECPPKFGSKPWGFKLPLKVLPNLPEPQARPAPEPMPRQQWPWYIQLLADQAMSADSGIGDVVERELGEAGIRYKAAMAAAGVPCGCDDRKAWLNARFPLKAQ